MKPAMPPLLPYHLRVGRYCRLGAFETIDAARRALRKALKHSAWPASTLSVIDVRNGTVILKGDTKDAQ